MTGHAGPVLDLKWCPFNDNLIASGADDCTVKLWHIPDGGLKTNMTEPLADLQGHQRRVSIVEWHPTAENILVSAGYDYQVTTVDVKDSVMILQKLLGITFFKLKSRSDMVVRTHYVLL